jgi:hypothetical protein
MKLKWILFDIDWTLVGETPVSEARQLELHNRYAALIRG